MPPDMNDLAMAIGYIVMGSAGMAASAICAWAAFEVVCCRVGFTRNLIRTLTEIADFRRNSLPRKPST